MCRKYPKLGSSRYLGDISLFVVIAKISKKQPWHYVALAVSRFLLKIEKKDERLWHYVGLSDFQILVKISKKTAMYGIMWRYPFLDFS